MNKQMNPARPALPTGLVAVDKGPMRDAIVGILTGNRTFALGFDVDGYAPNHYRVVPYGNFGVFAASKHPIEVRVLLDGELLLETQLFPSGPPKGPGIDAKVRSMMAERPQPYFLTESASGKCFTFAAHDPNLTPAQIIAEQIHAGAGSTPPTMERLDRGAAPTQETRNDFDISKLPEPLRQMLATQRAVPTDAAVSTPVDASNTADAVVLGSVATTAPDSTGTGAAVDASTGASTHAMEGTACAPGEEKPLSQVAIDPSVRSLNWAPSHGLVAIGVRMLQVIEENEPPRAPDTFTYVMFQLNPWKLHNLAQARLMGRVLLPSRESMRQVMEQEGFGSDAPQLPQVICGESCNHRKHRR